MPAPSNFLTGDLAKLQWAWDATSLRALEFCPRYYEYSIIEGYRGDAIDLEFGILLHASIDVFNRARLEGRSKEEAQLDATRYAMEASGRWEEVEAATQEARSVWVPWGGEYHQQWRCTGTEPFKNPKGNRAKCPMSHKGVWAPGHGPETCGTCGSPTESKRRWLPAKPGKDRYALVRTVIWYTDDQPESYEGRVGPYAFPNGTPAVELPFRLPLPYVAPDGTAYVLAGYLDGIQYDGDFFYVVDYKSTGKFLGDGYFSQYAPNVQMETYDFAASIMFPDLDFHGVRVEAMQTLVTGTRFADRVFRRDEEQREEYLRELGEVFAEAERYAKANFWPRRTANCYICPFKAVCRATPGKREAMLKDSFNVRKWNPLNDR